MTPRSPLTSLGRSAPWATYAAPADHAWQVGVGNSSDIDFVLAALPHSLPDLAQRDRTLELSFDRLDPLQKASAYGNLLTLGG